ncbi:hypothetical protein CUMW_096680 [Citrus unshiu]|uniref:AAA-type ATPase N-terminal domain-containing protein n=1 Tax=Citrus unshiu TaxID=55188 RepID=A0A2H5P2A0_CITUN|nr:hypothetical protein CUMW_096680 [Citrus unshiu]
MISILYIASPVYLYGLTFKVCDRSGERLKHSEVFSAIQNYLSIKASKHAARFKADVVEDSQSLVLSMEDKEEVTDEFERRRRGITSSHSINVTENSSQDPMLTMSWMEEGHHSEEPAAEAVQQQS